MSSEQELFYGLHLKVMCKSEAQYKAFLKVAVKLGTKVSWTAPMKDETTGEWHGFCNFRGSAKYQDPYSV